MIETGLYFDDIHSFKNLNLILSGSDIPPAIPKTSYIDIPGADGSIDLTEATGDVKFNDRECQFTFTMNPLGDLSEDAWESKKTEVSNILSGRKVKITLDKDSGYYYEGRCHVDNYASDQRVRQIVVKAKVAPYKMKQDETVIVHTLSSGEKQITIVNSRKSVSPYIECSNDNTTVVFGDMSFTLNAGTHKILDIVLVQGNNTLKVAGTGTVTFRFREGDL